MANVLLQTRSKPASHAAHWSAGDPARWTDWLCLGLAIVAIVLRVAHLANIPGLNGDEAWSGVQAWRLAHGQAIAWRTPTGNVVNLFFLLPLAGLHLVFGPSIVVLRSIALASGLAGLGANYWLCRKAFDLRTAAVSTLLLALLPINIAYSRFAWDASQSVLAIVLLMYAALIQLRRGPGGISLPAMLAMATAIIVHPTNVFALPLVIVPAIVQLKPGVVHRLAFTAFALAIVCIVARFNDVGLFATQYLQLFSGTTIYAFVSGVDAARSCDWLFGVAVLAGLWGMLRRLALSDALLDNVLVIAWCTMLAVFFLIAGPRAMTPHFERYAMCLIAPGVLLWARGLSWWIETERPHGQRVALVFAVAACWFPLSFYRNYWQPLADTGSAGHRTFLTANVEPKLTALRFIEAHSPADMPITIVCDEWWTYWPLAYLTAADPRIAVVEWTSDSRDMLLSDRRWDRTWFVGFAGQDGERQFYRVLHAKGLNARKETICNMQGRELLRVVGPAENLSENY